MLLYLYAVRLCCCTVMLFYCYAVVLSCCCTVMLLYSQAFVLSCCCTAVLLCCDNITLLHFFMVFCAQALLVKSHGTAFLAKLKTCDKKYKIKLEKRTFKLNLSCTA